MTISFSNREPTMPGRGRGCSAFTLLEVLIVISVISILLGMLLTAIQVVTRHTRRTIARAEVRMLESAWKQYITSYQLWPADEFWNAVRPEEEDGSFPYTGQVTPELASALQGRRGDGGSPLISGFNPDELTLIEFTRFDNEGAPVNSWWNPGMGVNRSLRFFFRIDVDDDSFLPLPDGGYGEGEGDTVAREVIVWTHDDRGNVIGSWRE